MSTITGFIRAAFEWVLSPVDRLDPTWGLVVVSIASGALILLVLKVTTPQRRLLACRRALAAALYEIRIFIDSPRRVAAAQLRLLGNTGLYLLLLLPGMAAASIPLGLLYVHLDVRYGLEPFDRGQPVVVRAALARDDIDGYRVSATTSPGAAVTAPALYAADENAVYFRVEASRRGAHTITIASGQTRAKKLLQLDPNAGPVSPERRRGVSALWALGTEAPLPADSPFDSISVTHPERVRSWLSLPVPWWVVWLVIATLAALLLRRPMRTTL